MDKFEQCLDLFDARPGRRVKVTFNYPKTTRLNGTHTGYVEAVHRAGRPMPKEVFSAYSPVDDNNWERVFKVPMANWVLIRLLDLQTVVAVPMVPRALVYMDFEVVKRMDIHVCRAMEIFGVTESEVTPDMRRVAKQEGFHRLYGGKKCADTE